MTGMRTALTILSLLLAATAAWAANGAQGKKLIEYGWDVPDTTFLRDNVREIEKVPFDGVVIRVSPKGQNYLNTTAYGWRTFSKVRIDPKDYEHAVEDLKATTFERYTDNFIQVISMPGDVDWFEPEWSVVLENVAGLARVAKIGGCKGIMFDPEQYGVYPIWTYAALPKEFRDKHTYEEYAAKVKERGREFIRAINTEFPDITILALFGPSLTYLNQRGTPIARAHYSLLVPFYDGICEAATPGTTLVDGYEFSYGFRTRDKFEEGRRIMLESVSVSANPEAFRKHVKVGFGVWVDNQSGAIGWHPGDFSKNYYSPEGFRASLNYALETSDKYVWVYVQRFRWWDESAPREFVEALRLAKEGPGPGQRQLPNLKRPSTDPREHAAAFEEFGKTMAELATLPRTGWKFSRDESDTGEENGWFSTDFDESAWREIQVGYSWEDMAESYNGVGWYRLKLTAPAVPDGKKVFIVFGAADESAWVWLNGKSVGFRDIGPDGWNLPFALEVTDALKPGVENTLAVKVLDREQWGGLWRPVKLMVK